MYMPMQAVSRTSEAPAAAVTDLNKQSLEELQQAFSTFTAMSEQLSGSYQVLEQRVVELSGELASLSAQRLTELNEKEQIAEQLASLLRLMPAAVVVLDNKGFIDQTNPAAESWLGQAMGFPDTERLLGKAWRQVVRLAFAPKQTDYHEVSLADGRLVSLATSPLDNSGQLIMMTDHTETRALQAQVARQERLTAMGQMVASLAHQVRTPLSAALLYASNLKSPRLTPTTHNQFVDKLVGRLHHLEKQVQDMLLYVKGECQLLNRLTLDQVVNLLQEAVAGLPGPAQARIHWQLQPSHAQVQCQSDVLISAFMNIINNALEAGDAQGTLTISSQVLDGQIEIAFRDTGPGISAAHLAKVQEPFFTTKSYGTGLGVPVLIATVKAHKGQLNISSQLNVGTEFNVTLPIFVER